MNSSIHNIARYIGKRTPQGVVVKKLKNSVQVGIWFVRKEAHGYAVYDWSGGKFVKEVDQGKAAAVLRAVSKMPD